MVAAVPSNLQFDEVSSYFANVLREARQNAIDYARKRKSDKRGGGEQPLPLDESLVPGVMRPEQLLDLDEALKRLETFAPRQGNVVVMRFFVGMSEDEISKVLEVSVRTVKRDWEVARAWLNAEMKK